MIDLSVQRFRGLEDVRLNDASPLSIVIGANEAGKSSLAQAIEFLFSGAVGEITGQQTSSLIARGHSDFHLRIQLPGWTMERTLRRGPKVSEIASRLRIPPRSLGLLFNLDSARQDNQLLVNLLNALEEMPQDSGDLLKDDSEARPLLERALASRRGVLRSAMQHAKEERARLVERTAPLAPQSEDPAESTITLASQKIETLSAEVTSAAWQLKGLQEQQTKLENALLWFSEQRQFEAALSLTSKDKLGPERASLIQLGRTDPSVLSSLATELTKAGRADLATEVTRLHDAIGAAIAGARQVLTENPAPTPFSPPAPLDEELCSWLKANGLKTDTDFSLQLNSVNQQASAAQHQVLELQNQLAHAQNEYLELEIKQTRWNDYRAVLTDHHNFEQARQKRWQAWDRVYHALESRLAQASGSMRDSLSDYCQRFSTSILGGRALEIDSCGRILVDGLSTSLLSGSTRWRLGVVVMAAAALLVKSPLLVLDGADVLDQDNRTRVLTWLISEIVPQFHHTILFSTARGDSIDVRPAPYNATKWLLRSGNLSPVTEPLEPLRATGLQLASR